MNAVSIIPSYVWRDDYYAASARCDLKDAVLTIEH